MKPEIRTYIVKAIVSASFSLGLAWGVYTGTKSLPLTLAAMYRDALNACRPRSAAELETARRDDERFDAVARRRSTMPPTANYGRGYRLTDAQMAQAKRAAYRLRLNGHVAQREGQ